MDYMEAAAMLGQALVSSREFERMKETEAALFADDKGQTLMTEFKELQMNMVKASRNENLDKEGLEAIRDALIAKQTEVNSYEITRDYFNAKKAFEQAMKNVNDIIQHFLNGGQGGCTGSCSSCGGCG